jgi:tetratricopeptide (TPR) repeat protein
VGQTAIGDPVNVASRLKDAADDPGVYISQDTFRLVGHLFAVEPLGELSVKGRRMPVTVYRVIGPRSRRFFPAAHGIEGVYVPMIGREAELAVLQDALLRAARDGQGGIITIIGEAGVGKSRLLREFHRWLEMFPVKATIFQARTDQRLTQVPYSFLRDLLIRRFEIDETDRPEVVESKIVKSLTDALPERQRTARNTAMRARARAIGRLVGISLPTSQPQPIEEQLSAAGREAAIVAILEYFAAVIGRSAVTLFFLEDIHWSDEDSLVVLERLAATTAGAPLLMVCLARPALDEQRPGWGGSATSTVRLMLSPLNETDSRAMVLSALRKLPDAPPALYDLIVRPAAGNPFYVEELIRVLIEDGVIVPGEEEWHLRPRELTRLRVPATLTGVLQSRLDRLPEAERAALQQAAVVGDEFWVGAVQQINGAARRPLTGEQVEGALHALERRGIIYRSATPVFAGDRAYLFKHAILRDVAYESVLLRDRPSYHLQAARWLEAQSGEWAAEYAAPIAEHLEQAGRAADAAQLYERAAGRAIEQAKYTAAIDYFRKSLSLLHNRPQHLESRLGIKERLGDILVRQGRLVEALEIFRAMHDSAALDGSLLTQARARIGQAAVYLELDENVRAREATTQAEQLARLTGADVELTRALLLQARAAERLGDMRGALTAATQAVERAQGLNARREVTRGLARLARIAVTGESMEALRAWAVALEPAADEDAAYALARLGRLALERGDYRTAQEVLTRALAIQVEADRPAASADTLLLLALTVCRAGDAAAALAYLDEAAALAESTGERFLRLRCRLAMGEALLAQGELAAAEASLRQVIATAEDRRQMGNWVELPRAYDLLVEALRRQGRRDEADRIAEQEREIGPAPLAL